MIFKLHSYDHTKIKKGMNLLFQLWHNKKTLSFTSRGQTCETMGKINEYLEKLLSVDEILHLIHICRETYIIITALPPFIVDLEHVFSQKNQHHHHCNVEKMKKYTKLAFWGENGKTSELFILITLNEGKNSSLTMQVLGMWHKILHHESFTNF